MNLSADDKAELAFCNARVLSDTGSFVKYGWSAIVDRCNALGNSGTTLVTNRYYFQKDHLGSIIGLTNSSGAVVWEYTYDVYGTAYARTGTGAFEKVSSIGSLYDNDRLFTGREYDGETGLYFYRARYYSADTGRFISRDPIGTADNVNLYTYVGNSPVMYLDAMGREKKLFIQNNEGNAWYIERYTGFTDVIEHAMMLFISNNALHLVSFYPVWTDGSNYTHESWANQDIALDYVMRSGQSNMDNISVNSSRYIADVTYISNVYIDNGSLDSWYDSTRNSCHQGGYNLFTHNCANEVISWLEAGKVINQWEFDWILPNTPDSLTSQLRNKLSQPLLPIYLY